jgi:hypothetical protein
MTVPTNFGAFRDITGAGRVPVGQHPPRLLSATSS